ncbi:MAG: TlpA disulfide reductase family protein [Solirubrobacteraceae bacterium]
MSGVLLAARCALAAVFAVAAAGKARDQTGARDALRAFGVPTGIVIGGAVLLPIAETTAAIALLIAPTATVGAALALALLVLFSAAIGRELAAGRTPECHCFGQLQSEPIGPSSLLRNVVLASLAVLVIAGDGGPSLTRALAHLDAAGVALVAVSVLAVALAVLVRWLWSHVRALSGQLSALALAQQTPGLRPGTPAPSFALESLAGGLASLEELLAPGRPVSVVFVSDQCEPCRTLLPSLGRWQQSLGERLTLATVFSGDREAARRLTQEHALPFALSQDGDEVFNAYKLRATPSAVLVDSDGTILAPPAEGEPAIEALIRSLLARDQPSALVVHPA